MMVTVPTIRRIKPTYLFTEPRYILFTTSLSTTLKKFYRAEEFTNYSTIAPMKLLHRILGIRLEQWNGISLL